MVVRVRQRSLRDRFLASASAGLLAAGLLIGSASPASAATTVSVSAPTVAFAGKSVYIQGSVSGSSNGATVHILKYTNGSWPKFATGTVTASRRFKVPVPIASGSNAFMAKVSKPGLATGYSKSVKVYGVTTDRSMILFKTNEYRKKYGLPALQGLSTLNTVAQNWTQQMFGTHPNGFKHNPKYFEQYAGNPQAGAENIATGEGGGLTSSNVVGKWMASPGHKANILGPYTHIGIGWVSNTGTAYATQNFAKY